jgi:uncharacterized protein YciI
MYWALTYELASDYTERRVPFQDVHRAHIVAAHERGEVALAGRFMNPSDTALIVFTTDSVTPVEEFARTDPYVLNGVATAWKVREWNVVVGGESDAA